MESIGRNGAVPRRYVMLQVKNISKTYKTGALTQRALAGVSLCLRDSEFVAVLGLSGSGKTTLLNVIGGLDRYDEGDLIINGKSTKKYKSRDWDAYRNHSVGFVFQSYNLIPHQSVLANVELALTIGGVPKRERVARAKEALSKVGLADHVHKKPSQLSGGQMQRVAIARALVNDPDILLADEPTGALDSDTSLQVMDLLKEVAKNRLVVMVTHNPELAERYATRIVKLHDGKIISDSDPFEPSDASSKEHKTGKSGMSFLTALDLSLKNLCTKKVRTLLVSFAGSIGIIGIAMILSMSNGANTYIKNIQEETLKSYPLEITKTSIDLASFLNPSAADGGTGGSSSAVGSDAEVREWRAVTNLFSRVSTNDLKSFKAYLESGKTDIEKYVQAIEYDYNVTPQIFSERGGKIRQVNPDRSFAALGFSTTDTMSSLMTSFSGTSSFFPMPSDPELYRDQYDVKAGRWPENFNECVIVLSKDGFISDMTLYTLGMKDADVLDEMVRAFAEGYSADVEDEARTYTYDEFLGVTFRLVAASDYYTYDESLGIWTDHSSDEGYMKKLVAGGEELVIVGVVQPSEDSTSSMMNIGIGYPASLTLHVMERAAASDIVSSQIDDPERDVFSGVPFGELYDSSNFDMASLFKIDEEGLAGLFSFDGLLSGFDITDFDMPEIDLNNLDLGDVDLSGVIDPSMFDDMEIPRIDKEDLADLFKDVEITVTEEDMESLFGELLTGFLAYSSSDPSTDYAKLPQAIVSYLSSADARTILIEGVRDAIIENGSNFALPGSLREMIEGVMSGFPDFVSEHEGEDDLGALLTEYYQSDEVHSLIQKASDDLKAEFRKLIISPAQAEAITSDLIAAYSDFAEENALPDPTNIASTFSEYMSGEEAGELIRKAIAGSIDMSSVEDAAASLISRFTSELGGEISEKISSALGTAISSALSTAADGLSEQIKSYISGIAATASAGIEDALADAMSFDPEDLASVFSFDMTAEELRDMMTSLLSTDTGSYESNMKKLGYAELDDPSTVTIYPVDFEGKNAVKRIIDDYNESMKRSGEDDKVIVYTDIVDALMSSVTTIINAISGVLIAFVAISLVVSSVMIGVITYISVLERRKEIGILRSIGASKRNISNVFNAETFIIGALAGALGIGLTYLLIIPANVIIHSLADRNDINAILPPLAAVLLIVLSIILTLIGGFIPSRKAAKSDPVAALRSE